MANEVLSIFRHRPGFTGGLSVYLLGVVMGTTEDLAIDMSVTAIRHPLAVFLAGCARVANDGHGSFGTRHGETSYIGRLTVRVQRPELAAGRDVQATAEKEGWAEVSHRLLAGGGESRRPRAVSNSCAFWVRWREVLGERITAAP